MKICLTLLIAILSLQLSPDSFCNNELSTGIRVQQSISLYNENGFTTEYASDSIMKRTLSFGCTFITSRLGSAFHSNAIKQDNILFHSSYIFSPASTISPLIRVNAGYCFADYESSVFSGIDNSMPLFSLEAGARYTFMFPVRLQASIGYNVITSDGSSGVGTVYPLFVQCSVFWNIIL